MFRINTKIVVFCSAIFSGSLMLLFAKSAVTKASLKNVNEIKKIHFFPVNEMESKVQLWQASIKQHYLTAVNQEDVIRTFLIVLQFCYNSFLE